MKYFGYILVFLSISAFAQQVPTLEIARINSSELSIGDTVRVDLHIKSAGYELSSFQMFVMYNSDVLKLLFVDQINENFKSNWHDNKTELFYAAVFADMNRGGILLKEEELLCELVFIYKGGETNLEWGTEEIRRDGTLYEGKTIFTDLDNNDIDFTLINGCVCKIKK
jgi:hypothetical protein